MSKNMEISRLKGVNNNQITIASGAVLIKDNKVLLTKDKKDNFWKFTGGTIRDDESLRETAVREVMEECGLSVEINDGTEFIVSSFHKDKEGTRNYYILFHYICKEFSGDINIQDENVVDAKWFDLDDLPENSAPNVKVVLKNL